MVYKWKILIHFLTNFFNPYKNIYQYKNLKKQQLNKMMTLLTVWPWVPCCSSKNSFQFF